MILVSYRIYTPKEDDEDGELILVYTGTELIEVFELEKFEDEKLEEFGQNQNISTEYLWLEITMYVHI